MGGPLSTLLANVFMDRLEQWVLRYGRYSSRVVLWYRFVDDIFCVWSGTNDELNMFTQDLQNYDPKLKFEVTDTNRCANYLDITVELVADEINDGLFTTEFSVYRKPQFTRLSIHNDSLHPMSQKLSVIHSAITRMLRLPLSFMAKERETRIIEQIAIKNQLTVNNT